MECEYKNNRFENTRESDMRLFTQAYINVLLEMCLCVRSQVKPS